MMQPTKDGFYWLIRKGKEPTIVKLYDLGTDYPSVAFIGTDYDRDFPEIDGEFIGPINPPEKIHG
jgi:hypothetical protein